jgi:hypothetical protein
VISSRHLEAKTDHEKTRDRRCPQCVGEEDALRSHFNPLSPNDTHTHTHTYIYIYIYVCVCVVPHR